MSSHYGRIVRAIKRDGGFAPSIETMGTIRNVLLNVEIEALRRCTHIAAAHGVPAVMAGIAKVIDAVTARGQRERRTIRKLHAASDARMKAEHPWWKNV